MRARAVVTTDMIFLATLLLTMFITIVLIPLLRGLGERLNMVDEPQARKIHEQPMPRSGGLAMAAGMLVPILLWVPGTPLVRSVLIGSWILVVFGLADDIRGLDYRLKFVGQLTAALVVIVYGGVRIRSLGVLLPDGMLLPPGLSLPLSVLVIIGVTNAINLADGLDGLAGGVCLLIFLCIGFLAYQSEQMTIALLSVAMAGAIFGFLRFNTYPATVFMGDTGSQFLGFFAATMSLQLTQSGSAFSPLLPLLLLGFPVLDTLTVMFERIADGRSPFAADLNHFHHKLMRLGLSHTESVLAIYLIQTFLVVVAYLFRFHSEWQLLAFYLLFSGIVLTVFFLADRSGWRMRRFALVDTVIKGRLKALLSQQIIIKTTFRVFQVIFPLLFLATCIAAPRLQPSFLFLYAGLLGLVVLVWVVKRDYLAGALRLGVYLLVPVMVYLSQSQPPAWLYGWVLRLYNLSFGVLALFVILTLRFTRRRGFKSTPLDFLILFVAVIVPNLPDEQIRSYQLGFIATKIIVFFFSYEVLMGELRGRLPWLGGCIILGLVIVLAHNLIL